MAMSSPNTPETPLVSQPPSLFRDGTASVLFFISFFLNFTLWVLPLVFIGVGEGTVVLRYNVYFGVDLTGSPSQVLLLPCMTTVFFVMNTLLAFMFVRKGVPLPGTLLLVAALFLHVAAIIAMSALIFIN